MLLEVRRLFEGMHDFQHVVSEGSAAAVAALSAFIKDRVGHVSGSDAAAVLAIRMAESLVASMAANLVASMVASLADSWVASMVESLVDKTAGR